ncbi:barstar family protein [Pseudomonas granadensis]|uniref:barstar family protein n=1 Tax=Pseudomonas granadensis TaxID=1421430 RepID=UPI0019D24263|nr:barstar family protein [Pseudomonas granadensis]MBN6774824.1 barstar family protein [Pseudomonas granadensis]MBN6805376.1 barstar family protein [Pseudomonas granadensis]MBN6832850.1 barstar family protein [Pseudomonas granadensis]MBN6839570.1 barstar family protein [Pseudomonas granadensis]MBN6868945.1 barstar family protein [Pseudomonas granadensis]
MIIELDGLSILNEQDFHKRIASAFSVSQYYGNNLNALWDLLSTNVERPINIEWRNSRDSKQNLGETYEKIIAIFERTKNQDISLGLDEKFNYELK